MANSLQLPTGYHKLLQDLKERIRSAQVQAALSVNQELVLLYWSIGRDLSQRFENEGWGTKINQRLAEDLQAAFPGVEGFSPRNLRYMRAFAEAWPEPAILQQLIAKLPWGHNLRVLDRIKDRPTREWYLRAALEHGWSQNVLVHMMSGQLHEREGKALTNFQRTSGTVSTPMRCRVIWSMISSNARMGSAVWRRSATGNVIRGGTSTT